MDFHASAAKNQTIIPHTTFSKTSTKIYEKVQNYTLDSHEKPPFSQKEPWKPPSHDRGGRGGHTSKREKTSTTRKEPENAPDTTPFIPKGALMHTQKPL